MDLILREADVEVPNMIETSYSTITCTLVAQGVGVAVVNPFVAHRYCNNGLVLRPFNPAPRHSAIMIFSKGKPRGRLVESFVAILRSLVAKEGECILLP